MNSQIGLVSTCSINIVRQPISVASALLQVVFPEGYSDGFNASTMLVMSFIGAFIDLLLNHNSPKPH